MNATLFRFSMALWIFTLSTTLHAATFNVADPTAFQNALTTAQANGQADTINVAAGPTPRRRISISPSWVRGPPPSSTGEGHGSV